MTQGPVRCLHTVLAERARAMPDRALLAERERCLTQRELLEAIDERARILLDACGGPDRAVAVLLPPGIETVISYFACLAAGLRYLPLPMRPARLVQRLLAAASPGVLVTQSGLAGAHGDGGETLLVDAGAARAPDASSSSVAFPGPDPGRVAHLLPTSGTETGTPKIVLTDHIGSLLSHAWRARLWPCDPASDVVGCNVFGIWDAVPALFGGIPLVMLDDETIREPSALAAAIVRYGITRLMLTPTLLEACLASGDAIDALGKLRRIVLCGERATRPLMDRASEALPGVRFGNLYSLAECHDVAGGDLSPGRPITCGRVAGFADVRIADRDDRERLLPAGRAGRVLVGGDALAAGYLDARKTAERFFEISAGRDSAKARFYDTGDLGVLHEDGTLEILGRIDDARKVRGAWAEPDAVAAVLGEHPGVSRAAVAAETNRRGQTQLAAFVVPREQRAPGLESSLRCWLAERVAAQSVPARMTFVDDLPVLPSGKIDMRSLVQPGQPRGATADRLSGDAPLSSTVLAAFRDVLERPDLGPDDDFESSGGDSLSAIVLCGELDRRARRRVRVSDLVSAPTPRALAARLERRSRVVERGAWQLPGLELETPRRASRKGAPVKRVFVTGATGALGRTVVERLLSRTDVEIAALVRADSTRHAHERLGGHIAGHAGRGIDSSRLTPIVGDLSLPRFGLEPDVFDELARRTDAIVHLGANLDMFAEYETLAAVNVGGTREALRLAFESGASVLHLSSSAVLPLDPESSFDEDAYGIGLAESLATAVGDSDGYSRSKLAAEALVWRAADRGLEVSVTRIPQLVADGAETRIAGTLRALTAVGAIPEGDWSWQIVSAGAVARHLATCLASPVRARLRHLITRPLDGRELARILERERVPCRQLPLPALVASLERARSAGQGGRDVEALNQLVREHGPRAALSLSDARLLSCETPADDPAAWAAEIVAGCKEASCR